MQLPPPSPVFAPHVRTDRCVTAVAFALPRVHESILAGPYSAVSACLNHRRHGLFGYPPVAMSFSDGCA